MSNTESVREMSATLVREIGELREYLASVGASEMTLAAIGAAYDHATDLGELLDHGGLAEPEPTPHWHIVEFIDGCLNDYDSGPIDTIEDAREELRQITEVRTIGEYTPAGEDRFERGLHILKIEECKGECGDE
jgi:hypothetical protein